MLNFFRVWHILVGYLSVYLYISIFISMENVKVHRYNSYFHTSFIIFIVCIVLHKVTAIAIRA